MYSRDSLSYLEAIYILDEKDRAQSVEYFNPSTN
jgi:hypothetical protein